MNEERLNEIESRIDDIAEEVYSSGDSSRKVGKLQNQIRDMKEEVEKVSSQQEENNRKVERLTSEEDILEEIKSKRKHTLGDIDKRKDDFLHDLNDKRGKLASTIDEVEEMIEDADERLEDWNNSLEKFDQLKKDLEDIVSFRSNKLNATLTIVQNLWLVKYTPPTTEIGSMIWSKFKDIHLLPSDKQEQLISFIVTWSQHYEMHDWERFDLDPDDSDKPLAAFVAYQRGEREIDDEEIDQVMGNLDDFSEAAPKSTAGSKVNQFYDEVLGQKHGDDEVVQKALEEMPHPCVLYAALMEEDKVQANIEWFDQYYELDSVEEARERFEPYSDIREKHGIPDDAEFEVNEKKLQELREKHGNE